ncbi:MAG: hypothetical protein MUC43_06690 [Pirellula sp.]|jgi:hypothetical protein|nr:hypothetical protein [Pirellula sp.]
MEQQILIFQLFIPFVLAGIGSWLITSAPPLDDWEPPYIWQSLAWMLPGVLLISLGIWMADFGRRGILDQPAQWLSWSSNSRWEWLVFLVPAAVLLLAMLRSLLSSTSKLSQVTWPVSIFLAISIMAWCLSDQFKGNRWSWEVLFAWMVVGCVAITVNLGSLENMAASGSSRWVLLVLAGQMGCISAYAAQSYLSLSLWITSCSAIVFGAFVCSLFRSTKGQSFGLWHLSILMIPLAIATVPTLFLADRYSPAKDRLPLWLIGTVMFLPTLVWFLDIVYTRECRQWLRVLVAFLICASVLSTIIILTKPFETEW